MHPSARVCVGQSVVPNSGESERVALRTRLSKILSSVRRGFDVTARLCWRCYAANRGRRRATRPAAGPPTPAIAGSRARGVTKATVRPPSLLNHSRRLASCCAPRHCRLSTPSLSRSWMESGGCTRSCHERGASPLGLLFWYLWRQSLPTRLTLQGSASANTIISSRVAYTIF